MLRLALHQINPTVGDIDGNTGKIIAGIGKAKAMGADLCAFPECAVPGYPAEDLLLIPSFIDANIKAIEKIAKAAVGITAVVGFVHRDDDLYNAAAILADGKVQTIITKSILPNYGVFDENRYFQSGRTNRVLKLDGVKVAVTICEDLWHPTGPARTQTLWGGAELVLNISASPYHRGKFATREAMLSTRASDNGVFLAYVNTVGGQDELVFDGNSALFDPSGEVLCRAMPFEQDLLVFDVEVEDVIRHRLSDPRRRSALLHETPPEAPVETFELPHTPANHKPHLAVRETILPGEIEEVYRALLVGIRDYAGKNGFDHVALGLSGGIDSALSASIAVDALGAANVTGITMPSPYSSTGSVDDSLELAANMGITCRTIPIEAPFKSFLDTLAPLFEGTEPGVAEENLQARIRGTLLMALSNKFGWLLLSTGNKSETSVGYCTLYGDMAGGFDILKDVPKTLVYTLSRWRNEEAGRPWIPVNTIEKEPSAELRPDQKDSDSLPDYDVLDPILEVLVEKDSSTKGLCELFGTETVARVARLVDTNEYKRRQAPPGVRITQRAFGKDRRYPITNRFKRDFK
jgi:NAD+ synthase (glutamine-hydrolysing)